jgi:hypothetical protein
LLEDNAGASMIAKMMAACIAHDMAIDAAHVCSLQQTHALIT